MRNLAREEPALRMKIRYSSPSVILGRRLKSHTGATKSGPVDPETFISSIFGKTLSNGRNTVQRKNAVEGNVIGESIIRAEITPDSMSLDRTIYSKKWPSYDLY